MSDRKVTISVETTSDNKGLEDITAAVKKLAAEEKKSGDVSKESGDKKKRAGQDTQQYGQAAGRAAKACFHDAKPPVSGGSCSSCGTQDRTDTVCSGE